MPRPKKHIPTDPRLALLYVGPVPTDVVAREHEDRLGQFAADEQLQVVRCHREPAPGPMVNRTAFVDLLVEAEGIGVGNVLTVDVAALAANPSEHALALRLIERAGARWLPATNEGMTWTEPEVEQVRSVLRQHEAMIYKPKVLLGQLGGPDVRPGGPPPWGYRRDEVTGQFVVDPGEEVAVRELVRMRGEGAGLGTMAAYLEGLQLPGRSGRIHKSTVKSILHRLDRRGGRP